MLRPIRWNTFVKDFFVIQIGFMLYGLALALLDPRKRGAGTWLVLEIALADILGIRIGQHDRGDGACRFGALTDFPWRRIGNMGIF